MTGHKLMVRLVLSGTKVKCDIKNCCVVAASDLDVHHVVPVVNRINNNTDNLRMLCNEHHALIEEFYWLTRKREDPVNSAQIEALALELNRTGDKTTFIPQLKTAWELHIKALDKPDAYWQKVYSSAKDWAQTKRMTKPLHGGLVIGAKDWYTDK